MTQGGFEGNGRVIAMIVGMVSPSVVQSRSVVSEIATDREGVSGGGDVDAKIRNPGISWDFGENQP